MVDAPQPTMNEDGSPSHTKLFAMRATSVIPARRIHSITHAPNRDRSIGTRSAQTSLPMYVNASAVSQARGISEPIDEWQWDEVEGQTRMRAFVTRRAGVHRLES